MATLTLAKALNEGLRAAMERDPKVLVMGEDVGKLGGVFRVTDGLQKDFGEQRVLDTPLAESGIIGTAVGLAIRGFRPVCEIQFDGFVFPGYDQIVSQLAKLHFRSQGRVPVPVVVRIPFGGGIGAVEHHSESPEALFAHVPGLKVVACSQRGRRLLDDPAGHRLRRPGDLLRAQAALLGEGRARPRRHPAAAAQRAGGAAGFHAHARRVRGRAQDVPGGGHRGGRGRQRPGSDRSAHAVAARPRPGRRVRAAHGAAGGGGRGAVGDVGGLRGRRARAGGVLPLAGGAGACASPGSTRPTRRPSARTTTSPTSTGCSTPSTARWRGDGDAARVRHAGRG